MLQQVVFPIAVAMTMALASAATADTLSEKLEKGIYTEETVGDLDAAIKIYEEIIDEARTNRKFVAQAQYRRGQCLLKQGKTKEAEKVFQTLVDQFKDSPDQKGLVDKARELLPDTSDLALIPVPWVDGEHMEMRVRLGGGLEIGAFILSARTGDVAGRDVWDLRINRNIAPNAPNLGFSRVLADSETFRPIQSLFRHSLLGTVEAAYSRKQVDIQSTQLDGETSDRKTDLSGVYFDNEQGMHLFRRLPLTEGYTAQLPIFVTFGGGAMDLETEVTGIDTIEVPAGKFECYKLLVKPVQQTFWISTDPHRYVVQFEAGGVTAVMQSVRQVSPGEIVKHGDDKLGYSLEAPADWYLIPSSTSLKEPEKLVMLLDPDAVAVSVLHVQPLDRLEEKHQTSVDAWSRHAVAKVGKAKAKFQVRTDSWQPRTVAGHAAVSCIADFEHSGKQRTEFFVFVVGGSTATYFAAHTDADRFDTYRKSLDAIVDTYQVD